MRVLLLSQYFYPENFPVNALATALARRDLELEVLTGQPNYPSGRILRGFKAWGCGWSEWQGLQVGRIPLMPRGEKSGLSLVGNYLSFVVSGLLFAPFLLRGRRYDVIFVYAPSPILQTIPALLLGRLKRAPVVLWVQDLWPDSLSATGYVRNQRVLGVVDKVVRWIYRRCDLLLGQSQAFVHEIAAKAGPTPVAYYPNSVDPIFEQGGVGGQHDESAQPQSFSVVFTGNVGSAQAVEVMLEAATLLRGEAGIHFVVYGLGSRWDWLQTQIQARGLENLVLAGQRPLQDMPAIMRQASVLLVTLADEPIFAATVPSKMQAYMAAGRPIIGCLNGEGARLLQEAKAGLAVPAGDAPALAEAVLRLYRMDAQEREALGANGQRYYREHFEHEKLVDQLVDLLATTSKKKKDHQ